MVIKQRMLVKVKCTVSTGSTYTNCKDEFEVEIDEDLLKEAYNNNLNSYLYEEVWTNWMWDHIDGGIEVVEK